MGYPNIVPADWWETELGWRNFFEHIPAVQLNHRLLAYSTGVPYMCALYVCLCVCHSMVSFACMYTCVCVCVRACVCVCVCVCVSACVCNSSQDAVYMCVSRVFCFGMYDQCFFFELFLLLIHVLGKCSASGGNGGRHGA